MTLHANTRVSCLLAMQFCGENLTQADSRKNKGSGRGASKGLQAKSGSRIRTCPSCVKPLPRCSVCLLTMNAANPALLDTSRRPKLQLQPAKLGQQPPNVRLDFVKQCRTLPDDRLRRRCPSEFAAWFSNAPRTMVLRQGFRTGLPGASAVITEVTQNVFGRGLNSTPCVQSPAANASACRRM